MVKSEANSPSLALLYWFHDKPEISCQRIRHLRYLHPTLDLHGLFGGPSAEVTRCREQVDGLSSFYASRTPDVPYWRWRNGDLVVLDWFVNKGSKIKGWCHVAIIHWDLLLLRPLDVLFPGLAPNDVFFCGLGELDPVFEREWKWTSPRDHERSEFERFEVYLRQALGYQGPLYRSLFAFAILPRLFLRDLANLDHPEYGFSEYKLPSLAQALGYSQVRQDLGTCWPHLGPHEVGPINGEKVEVKEEYIVEQHSNYSVYHPYYDSISDRIHRIAHKNMQLR